MLSVALIMSGGTDALSCAIAESRGIMDVNSFIIYLHELRNQCLYTHAALNVFNQSLQQNSPVAVLFAGQAALTSASHVGSILWPSRARARRRGEVLREKLQLPESHALGDRRFVELWEHADEKLDEWVKTTKGERVLFDFVGAPQSLQIPDLKESGIYRMYDTTNRVFVFRGVGYDFNNLAKAIEEIGRRAELLHRQIMERAQAASKGAQQASGAAQSTDSAAAVETADVKAGDIPSPVAADEAAGKA